MLASFTLGREVSGRDLLVVVVKGTFRIPAEDGVAIRLHKEQVPLVMSDVFYGEPGLSAPKYEVDFAPRKNRCDVLLNAMAYAPEGEPARRVPVGVRIGSWSKSFVVVGDRFWFRAGGVRATDPEPFTAMPITYDRAFGGTDTLPDNPDTQVAFLANPSGRGFRKYLADERLRGAPLPNTEEPHDPVREPDGHYKPMAFGIIGRHWEPRIHYAGTYDQRWLDTTFPLLPADFDAQYYQSAPPDQQLPTPQGEQKVTLLNLTPDGRRDFLLPHFEAPIHVFPKNGEREDFMAPVDTIHIEPDLERLTLTWRIARPLRKNIHEIAQVLIGRKSNEWWDEVLQVRFPIPVVVEPLVR